ncbi:hypothetical protein [Caulobacter sp. NIBR1757]|uniref:hypothetical protein n=1 Tax=Caulobacter sp. NIBR1757 TaxID=3016000 RepID=UPI0022F1269D|nr:hypothetical protein [Caulobacter sp. NIBR1757]WGM40233.1 hypothetical protein AMEJIAPC_03174 [Caulobacter sp. NIBR1757]
MTGARTRPTRARLRGFTLPLTLALAFAIMSMAAGLTGLVTVKAKAARQKDADLFALITLESATQAGLARLEKDGAPQTPRWEDSERLNNRQVDLTFLAVAYKPDAGRDPAADIAAGIVQPALRQRVVRALASPDPNIARASFARLGDFLKAAEASPSEEDCLRALLTFGRAAPQPLPLPPATALSPEILPLAPGDVVEVRAALRTDRYSDILWQRLRYTGTPGRPWHIHDWRRLRLAPGAALCKPPRP